MQECHSQGQGGADCGQDQRLRQGRPWQTKLIPPWVDKHPLTNELTLTVPI